MRSCLSYFVVVCEEEGAAPACLAGASVIKYIISPCLDNIRIIAARYKYILH